MKGNTQLRQESLKKVLTEIRLKGPVSKRELQRITGFSWGNISSIITMLCDKGFIVPAGKQDTGVGRKPEEFDINTEDNYIIGVDFNCAYVMATVCDLRGRIIASFKNEFGNAVETEEAIETLYKTVFPAVEFCGDKTLNYIAVAMQGDVDAINGVSVELTPIKGWKNIPVCQMLKDKFKIETIMFHDPDCVLYAERYFGVLGDLNIKNAVEVIFAHGMGMGALLENRIYRGNKGKSCEIKDLVVPSKNDDGYSGLSDIMESSESFIESYRRITGCSVTADELGALARKGDAAALGVFTEAVKALSFALVNVYHLFNPDKIVLFGEFQKYSDLIVSCIEALVKEITKNNFSAAIELSTLDNTATAVGASLFAADRVIAQLFFER